jgi:NitT/TauT family transport system substrate-binding protein
MSFLDHIRLGRASWIGAIALTLATAETLPAQTPLRFGLDSRLEGPVSFFLLAQDRGYFRSAGLDVTISEADNALDPINRVASGKSEMGFADLSTLITYRDRNPNAPVRGVFVVYNTPPYAIVARKSRGISEPKSLEGKRLGIPPAGSTGQLWPLFARLTGIDTAKVTVEKISLPVRAPMLAAGQLDAALGYSFRIYVDLKDRGVPVNDIVLMRMSNLGLRLYGAAIIVNTKFAAEHPEAVNGFLRAVAHGLRDTVRHPSAAIDSLIRRQELTKKDVELERLRMAIRDNIVTAEVRANGLGAVEVERLQAAIDQIGTAYPFKSKPKPDDVFDPTFLPPLAERRVN